MDSLLGFGLKTPLGNGAPGLVLRDVDGIGGDSDRLDRGRVDAGRIRGALGVCGVDDRCRGKICDGIGRRGAGGGVGGRDNAV
jgi:hypothetical protein